MGGGDSSALSRGSFNNLGRKEEGRRPCGSVPLLTARRQTEEEEKKLCKLPSTLSRPRQTHSAIPVCEKKRVGGRGEGRGVQEV